MSASITCSNVNGWSEIGLAFGMSCPPMASGVACSSADTSAEHAVPAACSASCYHIREDVRILPVIVAIRELGQVQGQVCLAHLMERANHAPLQQAPEGFQVVRVDAAPHVLFPRVIDRLMRELLAQAEVAGVLIRGHQRHVIRDGFPHKAAHRHAIRRLDHLADHIAFTRDRANDRGLAAVVLPLPLFLVPMLVRVLTANIRFIHFHFAHELAKAPVLHGGANAMAHIPGRAVGPAANDPLDLQGANAFLALQHQINDLEPGLERIVRVFKDRARNHGEAVAVPSATILRFADPMKRAALERKHLSVLAAWAVDAIRPTALLQEFLAGVFVLELRHHFRKCLAGFRVHGMASVMLRPFYTNPDVVSSRL